MPHVVYQPEWDPPPAGTGAAATGWTITIRGDEAHHAARVKRLEVGDGVRVHDGAGLVGEGVVSAVRKAAGAWEVDVTGSSPVLLEANASPRLRVLTGVPKGDRLEQMIDGLSQAGAASWGVLESERVIVDPREGKIERLQRTCEESLKQCGRAWLMEVGERVPFRDALRAHGPGHRVVVADAAGGAYTRAGLEHVTLLVGPEGGFSPAELAAAHAAGAVVCAFGVHTMRVETAAVVAAAVVMDRERAG